MEAFLRVASTKSRKVPLILAAACLASTLALAGCSSMGETNVHGIVITDSMLAQIKPGMTPDAVVSALGTPSTTSTLNGEAYYYVTQTTSKPVAFMKPHITDRTVIVVYFDKGKVTRTAKYGLQDGVVFDFISRSTPTAGSEQSFLRQLFKGMTMGVPGFGG